MTELTPACLRDLLAQNGITLSKRFGQNFLIDRNVLAALGKCLPEGDEIVFLEIGAGALALTALLAQRARRVVAYEIDQRLIPVHQALMAGDPVFQHTELRYEDALEGDWNAVARPGETLVLAGNLPYLHSSEIMLKLVASVSIGQAFLMFQREFALRLLASPGTHDYGSLTVVAQTFFVVRHLLELSPEVFFPRPTVSSTFLALRRRESGLLTAEVSPFLRFVQRAFMHRRKKLSYFFRQYGFVPDGEFGVFSDLRPEALTPVQFVSLFHAVTTAGTL